MKPYTKTEENILKEHYSLTGVSGVQKYIKRSADSIRHKAKSLGITRKVGFRHSNLNLDEFYVKITPNGAYFLGLLWGDGNLKINKRHNSISITLQEKDFNNLRYIFNKFHIHKVKKKKQSWQQCFKAYIGHFDFATFLFENDYVEKSTLSPYKILSFIKDKYHHYFLRGWFDADGACNELPKGKYHISLSGSFNQDWTAFTRLCENLDIKTRIYFANAKNGNKSSHVSIIGFNNIIRFRDFLYSGKKIGLDRKRNKFYSIRPPLREGALNP